jgi:hypothetical protein
MSDTFFYGLPEQATLAFGHRIRAVLAGSDQEAWATLFDKLAVLRQRPYIGSDGATRLDPRPLIDFVWYLPPTRERPTFSPGQVPGPDSEEVQWLLTNLILQWAEPKLAIRWPKFGFGWTISVADDHVVQPGPEQYEFDLIAEAFFHHPRNLPRELWFLNAASHLNAYATVDEVRQLVEVEKRVALLQRLARHYQSSDEPITQSFGAAVETLHHFLSTCAAQRVAVFMCYLGV